MMERKFSVILADDHTILRQGLRALLDMNDEFEVAAEASDGLEAIRSVREKKPDILIMDLSMPKMNGIEAIREIRRDCPETKIIVLTVHDAEEYVFTSLRAGADGYVLKDADNAELILAMKSVLRGNIYLTPGISGKVVQGYLKSGDDQEYSSSIDLLTRREREILKLVAEGYRNKEIGDLLFISPKTVEKHRENLMRKLNIHSASAIIAYAREHGLI